MKNNYSRLVIIALITIIIFLCVMTVRGYAAGNNIYFQTTIYGKVVDKEGLPIPGVAVNIKNSNKGTVTNLEGEFSIQTVPNAVLVFSYLGYKAQEVPVKGRSEINITMEEDVTALDEVEINAGYYNTTRRESTGNISRVTAEEIELQPVVSPLQALQGRMTGVEIIPGGSHPGSASTIRIRGRNSLRDEGNYPLYIIDGVPVNSVPIETNTVLNLTGIDPLNNLDLSSIESIEVLKDADATAIYGSRGANGVVLITTKKGHYGKIALEARVYTGASTLPNRIDLLNTEQYLQIRRQAFENDGVEPTATNAYDLVLWDQERYTDWQDVFFGGTAKVQDVNVAATGGSENTFFRIGGTYHKQGSIYPGDYDYQKATGGLNLNHRSQDHKLTMDFALTYGLNQISSVGDVNLGMAVFTLPPNAPPIFNEDGGLHWEEWASAGLNNPFTGYFNTSETESNNLLSSLNIAYEILPGLRVRSNFGYNLFQSRELLKRPRRSYNPASWESIDHSSSHLDNYTNSWIIEPQLVYDKVLGKFTLNAILGGSLQERTTAIKGIYAKGYVAESLIGNLTAVESLVEGNSINTEYRYAALFGRLGLDWEKKYFLNFTGRRDGSSRFGPGKRLANFWAVGGAWIFTEEPIFKQSEFLSFGKIRGSYGTSGSDQIGDYQYLDAYEATPGPGGLYPTQLFNPDYSWEVNKKLELALDLGFLNDRLNLGLSWYQNRSSNQLVGYSLPAITGFTSIQANLPATVENKGLEIELSTINIQKDNFSWQTFLNITIPKNELLKYPGIEESSYANRYKVGEPLYISLLYQYEGLDPETGFYTVTDANEDGRYDFNDRTVVQHLGREYYGGISNQLTYKDLSLQFLIDFVKQEGDLELFNAGRIGNQREEVLQALNGNSSFQQISASSLANTSYLRVLDSTFPIVDASFMRLRNLSLAYSLPLSILKGIGLQTGKVFLNGQNLYTLTSYKGMDPEMPKGGMQFGGLRTITGGLQVQF